MVTDVCETYCIPGSLLPVGSWELSYKVQRHSKSLIIHNEYNKPPSFQNIWMGNYIVMCIGLIKVDITLEIECMITAGIQSPKVLLIKITAKAIFSNVSTGTV